MSANIRITSHAIDHWCGRCRQPALETRRETAALIARAVADGRMGTKLEARMLSLWVSRAKYWGDVNASVFMAEQIIVSEEYGVVFAVALDAKNPVVMTAVGLRQLYRYGRGVQGSKMKRVQLEIGP